MKSNSRRTWIPPSVTKLAIQTHTKSPVPVDAGLKSGSASSGTAPASEPLAKPPVAKFGFSLEWSFPLAVRTD
jgi:hypothetical protein